MNNIINEKILIVDHDNESASYLCTHLESFGYSFVPICTNLETVRQAMSFNKVAIAIVKVHLQKEWDGLKIASWIYERTKVLSILVTPKINENFINKIESIPHFAISLNPYNIKEILLLLDKVFYYRFVSHQTKEQNILIDYLVKSDFDSIIFINHEHKIIAVNQNLLNLLGETHEEKIIGISLKDLISLKTYQDDTILCDDTIFDFFTQKQLNLQEVYLESPFSQKKAPCVKISFIDVNVSFIKLIVRIKDVSESYQLKNQLDFQLRHDNLTGLLNRRYFYDELEKLFLRSKVDNQEHILAYLDIDKFRLLNKSLGEETTNLILKEVTKILIETVGFSDKNKISRLGTDDFAILLPNTTVYKALEISWLIKRNISNIDLVKYGSVIKMLPASIGIVRFNGEIFQTISDIVSAAQNACLMAKSYGGNQIKIYESQEAIFKNQKSELFWISSLSRALENNLFQLFYQDIVPLKEHLSPKIEILLRFYNEEGERVPPQEFILMAEANGMMPEIDKWVISNALKNFHSFNAKNEKDYIFSINISAETIKRSDIVNFILQEIEKNAIPPHMVYFEITETALIQNIQQVQNFILQLKESEISCSLDDFGNGYTSFSSLKELPVEVLKVDGLFVKNIVTDQVSQAVVYALRQLTEAMGIIMVAEFIENEEILAIIKKMGTDYGQGYLWGTPKPLVNKNEK